MANYAGMQRSPKISPARADEFMPALVGAGHAREEQVEQPAGILLPDPEAQSNLIKQLVFGI